MQMRFMLMLRDIKQLYPLCADMPKVLGTQSAETMLTLKAAAIQ